MILNHFAVLCASLGLLRLLLGLGVLALGVHAWRASKREFSQDDRLALEQRCYFVFLLTILLLLLNLISWPLLYLLLQSYVPEWPGVMCIYGVTQIGNGSLGSSRFLPGLLEFLQVSKPALAFASGGWFVIHLLNRRTRTAPLLRRLFVMLVPLGLLALADALAELAYVVIPKKEEFPSSGCCTGVFDDAGSRFRPHGFLGDSAGTWLSLAYYVLIIGHMLMLAAGISKEGSASGSSRLSFLLIGSVLVSAIGALFLVDVFAPTLLQLPYHHCPYDLIPQAPESLLAVGLFVAGCFFLGWACLARWVGDGPETHAQVNATVQRLLRLSLWSHVLSLVMVSVEMALA